MRRSLRPIAIVLAAGVTCLAIDAGRFLALAIAQEGRPTLAVAALRIAAGADIVEVDDDLLLASTAMDRRDGDWPLRKHLAAQGLVLVDQLGAMLVFRDRDGRRVTYVTRMFTRAMMVAERQR